jgi:SAM-dependent methyltransferase
MKSLLSRLFPGVKTFLFAWRSLWRYRPAHLRPLLSLLSPPPAPLEDMPPARMDPINEASKRYFQHEETREFWLNRPFSERPPNGVTLARFGLLVSAIRMRPDTRILDFGCGTGWTSIMLARMGADVVGMDIAPEALAIAREAARRDLQSTPDARLRFEVFGGRAIAAGDESFDAVVVFDAFHHFPNPRTLLSEFARVLVPHGSFGFAEPGIGHAQAESSHAERERGVLEQDVDIEQLYRSGRQAGFGGLEMLVSPLGPDTLMLPMSRLRWYLRGLTWLVPPDFNRVAILTGPMGVFHKGPHPVTSLLPRAHRASLRAPESFTAKPGEPFTLSVRCTNRNEMVWLREARHGRGYVRLGAHLLDENGEPVTWDYGRAALPRDVPKGASVDLSLLLTAPATAGRYLVRLDMVNEGICWFAQEGSTATDVRLEVARSR